MTGVCARFRDESRQLLHDLHVQVKAVPSVPPIKFLKEVKQKECLAIDS